MTPPAIVAAAALKGLALIAICDHNTAGNAAATQEAASLQGGDGSLGAPAVLAGIEITTAEEAHVLGLFPDSAAAEAAAEEVLATLPPITTADDRFGEQLLLDSDGNVRGKESRMLAAASTFGLSDAVRLIHSHGGLAIAAHVDRPSFSVISQLGVFPAAAGFDAVELGANLMGLARATDFDAIGLPVVHSSDSHSLGEIGEVLTEIEMRDATFEELSLALRSAGGRRVCRA
jgi:hypothetical protein